MSRKGNCWDNAVMERFFRSLKTERLNYQSFANHYEVVQNVVQWHYSLHLVLIERLEL
jgi:transposase InsO family protein